MGKIYKGQTKLVINVTVGQDITGATTTQIKYKKPSNTLGYFDATIIDSTNGIIKYSIQDSSDLGEVGTWLFWAYIVFSDGSTAYGEVNKQTVSKEGS